MTGKIGKRALALAAYRSEMDARGWRRISAYASPALVQYLRDHKEPGVCTGRILETAVLGYATPRLWKRPV